MQVILSPESWPAYVNAGYLIPESWPAYAHSTPRWQSAFHRRVAFNLPAIATRRISPVRFQSNQTPVPQTNPVGGGTDAPEGTLKSEMAEPLHVLREKLRAHSRMSHQFWRPGGLLRLW